MALPTDAQERKATPIFSGVLMYFPDAVAEVARCSLAGNEQHHPGTPLHWDKSKSKDEDDACVRHLMDARTEKFDADNIRHRAKAAWRALAGLQREIDKEKQDESEKLVDHSSAVAGHLPMGPWVPAPRAEESLVRDRPVWKGQMGPVVPKPAAPAANQKADHPQTGPAKRVLQPVATEQARRVAPASDPAAATPAAVPAAPAGTTMDTSGGTSNPGGPGAAG